MCFVPPFIVGFVILAFSLAAVRNLPQRRITRAAIIRRCCWLWSLTLIWFVYGGYEIWVALNNLWLRADLPCIAIVLLLATVICIQQFRRAPARVGSRYGFGCCKQCGYNLTGNITGRCPECGAPISPSP